MHAHVPFQPIPEFDEDLHSVPMDWHSDDMDADVWSSPEPDEDYKDDVRAYRELYRCEIDYLDRVLAPFVDDLLLDTDRETTVVITSDHGENLGYESDEYLMGHNSMSHSILHTPFEIVNPPSEFPTKVPDLFSHLQLGSLIQLIADDRPFDPGLLRDIVPAEVPRAGGLRRSNERAAPRFERMVRCAIESDSKYLWDSLGARERYELSISYASAERLVEEDVEIPERAREFFSTSIEDYLVQTGRGDPESMELDPATKGQLEEVGYL